MYQAPIIYTRTLNVDFTDHLLIAPSDTTNTRVFNLILNSIQRLDPQKGYRKLCIKHDHVLIFGYSGYLKDMVKNDTRFDNYIYCGSRKSICFMGISYHDYTKDFQFPTLSDVAELYLDHIQKIWNLPLNDDFFKSTMIVEYEKCRDQFSEQNDNTKESMMLRSIIMSDENLSMCTNLDPQYLIDSGFDMVLPQTPTTKYQALCDFFTSLITRLKSFRKCMR